MVIKLANSKNSIAAEFDNKLKIQEYAKAYQLYDLRYGRSSGREWKSSVFFFLALAMFFMLAMENFNFAKLPVTVLVLLISMYMCTHYLYLLPKAAKLEGEHIYKSSHLLSKPCHITVSRDSFTLQNDYEYLKRYYTELTDCFETDEIFVLIGGMEHVITVISKRCLTDEQTQILSEHFQRETIQQYRRIKSSKKRK